MVDYAEEHPQAPRLAVRRHSADERSVGDGRRRRRGYVAYLRSLALPEHYWLFLIVGALSVAALFPLFRLYEPQRGISIVVELRQLTLAWALLTGIAGGALFATKSGDAFSRVWVAIWLSGDSRRRSCCDSRSVDCCACCDDAATT